MKKAFIYGLFARRRCVYVGVTIRPDIRCSQHRSSKGRNLRFKILGDAPIEIVGDLERALIVSLWCKGLAKLNRCDASYKPRKFPPNTRYCFGNGKTYLSVTAAARDFGVCVATMVRSIKRGYIYKSAVSSEKIPIKFKAFSK